jgi:hypothetical protein
LELSRMTQPSQAVDFQRPGSCLDVFECARGSWTT